MSRKPEKRRSSTRLYFRKTSTMCILQANIEPQPKQLNRLPYKVPTDGKMTAVLLTRSLHIKPAYDHSLGHTFILSYFPQFNWNLHTRKVKTTFNSFFSASIISDIVSRGRIIQVVIRLVLWQCLNKSIVELIQITMGCFHWCVHTTPCLDVKLRHLFLNLDEF